MSPIVHKPPIVANASLDVELLRQKLQRMREWNCPLVTQDPGFGQMPPGMLWIRTDMVGCERYRFYDENGNIFTLCGDSTATSGIVGVTNVMFLFVAFDDNDDKVDNTTTETFFATKYTFPANDTAAQDIYRVRIRGVHQNGAGGGSAADAEMRLRLYIAGVEVLVTEDGEGNGLLLRNPLTNHQWMMEMDIGIIDPGASGAVHAHGRWGTRKRNEFLPNTEYGEYVGEGGSGIAFDGTTAQDLEVSVQFSVADTDLWAALMQVSVERLRVG